MKAKNILLIAYQCGPEMGSVSQIGWEWYQRLSQTYQLTLVTHSRNRQALTQAGAPLGKSEVIYIDTEWFAGPWYRLAKRLFPRSEHAVFMLASLDYFIFDWQAFRVLRQRMRQGAAWQICHRTTPVTLSAPTWLGRLGLPTILGPLNSGLACPNHFEQVMKQESGWLIHSRALSKIWDFCIGSSRHIDRLLVATQATFKAAGSACQQRCQMMLENGVDLQRFQASSWPTAPSATQALRILFVGRLVPVKSLDLLLHALVQVKNSGRLFQLDVIGDGPMFGTWEQLSQSLGLAGCVRFYGALPLKQVAQSMQDCHVFCLPSIRESGGAVLLEAMACARPVIALDYGGPSEIVHSGVGCLIPLHHPTQVIHQLAESLCNVRESPELWRQRGLNARQEVEQRYSWDAKVKGIDAVYAGLIPDIS